MPKTRKRLTDKQQRFIEEYPVDFNASAAAQRAGYSPRTCGAAGHNLLQDDRIQKALGKHVKKLTDKAEVTVERVLKEYARLAFFDIGDLFDENGDMLALQDMPEDARRAIGGIDVSQIGDEETVKKIKIIDKKGALDSIGKYLKMFIEIHELGEDTRAWVERMMQRGKEANRRLKVIQGQKKIAHVPGNKT